MAALGGRTEEERTAAAQGGNGRRPWRGWSSATAGCRGWRWEAARRTREGRGMRCERCNALRY